MSKTSEANIKLINCVWSKMTETMTGLGICWLTKSQCEDDVDYSGVIRKQLPKDITLTKMTCRPFGFQFSVKGEDKKLYHIQIKANGFYSWARIK